MPANVRIGTSDYRTIDARRTTLRASEGLEVLIETGHIHRSRCARYWKGRNKDCHRSWQPKSNSTTRSEVHLNEAVYDPSGRPESVTAYEWSIQSGAFQVPQFANTQKQYMLSQGPNIVSDARDDYFIRSSLPKLKLAESSGDQLEWPEWSQLFQATVHAANIDDSVKMNHLKQWSRAKPKRRLLAWGTPLRCTMWRGTF